MLSYLTVTSSACCCLGKMKCVTSSACCCLGDRCIVLMTANNDNDDKVIENLCLVPLLTTSKRSSEDQQREGGLSSGTEGLIAAEAPGSRRRAVSASAKQKSKAVAVPQGVKRAGNENEPNVSNVVYEPNSTRSAARSVVVKRSSSSKERSHKILSAQDTRLSMI